jgi:hypothetical protein
VQDWLCCMHNRRGKLLRATWSMLDAFVVVRSILLRAEVDVIDGCEHGSARWRRAKFLLLAITIVLAERAALAAKLPGEPSYAPTKIVSSVPISLEPKQITGPDNQEIVIHIGGNQQLHLIKIWQERIGKSGFGWHGQVAGEPNSRAILAVSGDGTIAGTIARQNGHQFRIRLVGQSLHFEEISRDVSSVQDNLTTDPCSAAIEQPPDWACTDSRNVIDVMVLYTNAAAVGAGGVSAMESDIDLAIAQANESRLASDVVHRLNLVYVSQVSYSEGANTSTQMLNCLRTGCDPSLANVHQLRNDHAADLVVLITESVDACGQSCPPLSISEDRAYSVVSRDCSTRGGDYAFVHETGHLMGARHNMEIDATQGSPLGFMFNHGYRRSPQQPDSAGTVMYVPGAFDSCATVTGPCFDPEDPTVPVPCPPPCPRTLAWSNPALPWPGTTSGPHMGSATSDNYSTLEQTEEKVANFRCLPAPGNAWMKDTWEDNGAEPDTLPQPMWRSPYIWNRNVRDTRGEHRHQHENPVAGVKNYLYIKIHNTGEVDLEGKLVVNAAKTSTGLSWPSNWTYVAGEALDGTNMLRKHTTRIVELEWIPQGVGDYCLIARWMSDADPMHTPEGASIIANVRNNNNIIWRNMHVVRLDGRSNRTVELLVQNPSSAPMRTSLLIYTPLRPQSLQFLNFGSVALELDDDLDKAWSATGRNSKGLKNSGGMYYLSEPEGATLYDLDLPPQSSGRLRIVFGLRPDVPYPETRYVFDVVQLVSEDGNLEVFGGVSYDVQTVLHRTLH